MTLRPAALAAALLLASTPAFAVGNSWWGGEILANQAAGKGNGIGYGLYEAKLIPSTGKGSITGFFNLCYTADNNFADCILYNKKDQFHLEIDALEFTPLGNNPQNRRWIDSCNSDSDCAVSHPNPPPRTNEGSLKAVSFNTFPGNNQVYARTKFNPYAEYHTYSVLVLPDQIVWKIDGEPILTRTRDAGIDLRKLPPGYANFDQLLRNGRAKLRLNVWDGSQGTEGGFGGPPTTQQSTGQEGRIQRVAYYAATCDGDVCTLPDEPSFLTDFEAKRFIKDGKEFDLNSGAKVCDRNGGNRIFWQLVRRDDFPVYVNPGNVNCSFDNGIYMYMTKTPMP